MADIKKFKVDGIATKPRWSNNITFDFSNEEDTEEIRLWLEEMFDHKDVYSRNDVWLLTHTNEPVEKEVMYFFWGPGCIQFKNEQDMVAFILKFSG